MTVSYAARPSKRYLEIVESLKGLIRLEGIDWAERAIIDAAYEVHQETTSVVELRDTEYSPIETPEVFGDWLERLRQQKRDHPRGIDAAHVRSLGGTDLQTLVEFREQEDMHVDLWPKGMFLFPSRLLQVVVAWPRRGQTNDPV